MSTLVILVASVFEISTEKQTVTKTNDKLRRNPYALVITHDCEKQINYQGLENYPGSL